MPFLDSIVEIINDSIKTKIDASNVVLSQQGISKQLPRTDEDNTQIPAYVTNKGEGEFNAIDDRFSLTMYHKCESLNYEPINELAFGDGEGFSRETATMALIVWGDRKRLQTTQEWMAATVASGFPYGVDKSFKQARPGLSGVAITINSVENDSQSVWGKEFRNIEYMLPPESLYFQLNYTIETVFHKSCLELCEECPPITEENPCDCDNVGLIDVQQPNNTIIQIMKTDGNIIPINLLFTDVVANPQLLVSKLLAGGCNACSVVIELQSGTIYSIIINNQSSTCQLSELFWTEPGGQGEGNSSFYGCL